MFRALEGWEWKGESEVRFKEQRMTKMGPEGGAGVEPL